MNEHEFTVVVSGVDPESDYEDSFFEAGCDDATLMLMNGLVAVCFARQATSFEAAIVSALEDIGKTGAKVERLEPDFLVSRSEIAERAKLTKAAVSNYAAGERGENFPAPVARITSANPLWDWVIVAEWLATRHQLPEAEVRQAKVMRAINRHLANAGQLPAAQLHQLIAEAA